MKKPKNLSPITTPPLEDHEEEEEQDCLEATMTTLKHTFAREEENDSSILSDPEAYACRKMVVALIERAYLDCFDPLQHVKRDARHFIFSDEDGVWTFKWMVEELNAPDLLKAIRQLVVDEVRIPKGTRFT